MSMVKCGYTQHQVGDPSIDLLTQPLGHFVRRTKNSVLIDIKVGAIVAMQKLHQIVTRPCPIVIDSDIEQRPAVSLFGSFPASLAAACAICQPRLKSSIVPNGAMIQPSAKAPARRIAASAIPPTRIGTGAAGRTVASRS